MSFAGDVDLTILPLPRTAASCTMHWRLPRRFQSVVNPTRIATSSFVGHFSGRRARARATARPAIGRRGRETGWGPLWWTRCQSRDISLLCAGTGRRQTGVAACVSTRVSAYRGRNARTKRDVCRSRRTRVRRNVAPAVRRRFRATEISSTE